MITPVPAGNGGTACVTSGAKERAVSDVAKKARNRNVEDENARRADETRVLRTLADAIKSKQGPI